MSQVKVIDIAHPVTVHEICNGRQPGWPSLAAGYEDALGLFERQEFLVAAHKVGELFKKFAEDDPSLKPRSRAVGCLVDRNADRSPIWRLPEK